MKILRNTLFMTLMVTTFAAGNIFAAVANNEAAPDFTLTDTNGQEHNLSDFQGKYVVLEWINYDCPFIKKFYKVGSMQSMQEDVTAQDTIWLSINSSAEGKQGFYSPEQVNEIIANSNAHPTAYLYDTDGSVGKAYGAKTTPHMYVINPEGVLIYQGAIDSIPSADSADISEADNYVLQALGQAAAGEEISSPITTPYGCSVKY